MSKSKYRAKNKNRKAYRGKTHPKIFVFSHTERAEIEYFQDFKGYLRTHLLIPRKIICWTPQELLQKIIDWKNDPSNDKFSSEDGDCVWCIFDVDDFFKNGKKDFLNGIKRAEENNIKIAYANECFELWILLHFEKPTSSISRGRAVEKKIIQAFKKNNLGEFKKNHQVFQFLLPFQKNAIKNAKSLLPVKYREISWEKALSEKGNPSTSIHFLIEEIKKLIIL